MPTPTDIQHPANPLTRLRQTPGSRGNQNALLLAGESYSMTQFLVIWFPVFTALCYGFIAPFTFTIWGENNLLLILAIWLCSWAVLALFTLTAGTGRHVYHLNLNRREISHTNTDQTTSLTLKLIKGADKDTFALSQPLDSGWHLDVNERTLSELTSEEAEAIPVWQPASLKECFEAKLKDGSLSTLFIYINIPLGVVNFVMATGGVFVITQLAMLTAWFTSLLINWLLEWRDYRTLVRS